MPDPQNPSLTLITPITLITPPRQRGHTNHTMPSQSDNVRIGIIGGGLMGREIASAFARWCTFEEPGLPTPVLTAVADLNPGPLSWFQRIPTAKLLTSDYQKLLASPDVDVVYVAVPHNLHLQIYNDVIEAGKDLLAEKPFGIDLNAATNIVKTIRSAAADHSTFVRCSSPTPSRSTDRMPKPRPRCAYCPFRERLHVNRSRTRGPCDS